MIGAVCLYIGLKFPDMSNTYLDILVRSSLVTALFGGLIFWLKPSMEVNTLVTQIWNKVTGKK